MLYQNHHIQSLKQIIYTSTVNFYLRSILTADVISKPSHTISQTNHIHIHRQFLPTVYINGGCYIKYQNHHIQSLKQIIYTSTVNFYLRSILTAGRSPHWFIERSSRRWGAEPPPQHQQTASNNNHHQHTSRKADIRTNQLTPTTFHNIHHLTTTAFVISQVSNISSIILKQCR